MTGAPAAHRRRCRGSAAWARHRPRALQVCNRLPRLVSRCDDSVCKTSTEHAPARRSSRLRACHRETGRVTCQEQDICAVLRADLPAVPDDVTAARCTLRPRRLRHARHTHRQRNGSVVTASACRRATHCEKSACAHYDVDAYSAPSCALDVECSSPTVARRTLNAALPPGTNRRHAWAGRARSITSVGDIDEHGSILRTAAAAQIVHANQQWCGARTNRQPRITAPDIYARQCASRHTMATGT
jgi:hypothetical protein